MRKGKRQIIIYLDSKEDADIIELCKAEGFTKTIREALKLYELGRRMCRDLQKEEENIEGVPYVGGYADGD